MPQTPPLYAQDREIVDRVLSHDQPTDLDIADMARLVIRYAVSDGGLDIPRDIATYCRARRITRHDLNSRARQLWESGWRPTREEEQVTVGSGADVEGD